MQLTEVFCFSYVMVEKGLQNYWFAKTPGYLLLQDQWIFMNLAAIRCLNVRSVHVLVKHHAQWWHHLGSKGQG